MENKTRVEEGQPVLILEAMKMEVCTFSIWMLETPFFIYSASYNQKRSILFLACCKGTFFWLCAWASTYGGWTGFRWQCSFQCKGSLITFSPLCITLGLVILAILLLLLCVGIHHCITLYHSIYILFIMMLMFISFSGYD